jgi:hypothetical protein
MLLNTGLLILYLHGQNGFQSEYVQNSFICLGVTNQILFFVVFIRELCFDGLSINLKKIILIELN